MKVTRQRNGVKVMCNDSEFGALQRIAALGMPLVAGKEGKPNVEGLTGRAKGFLRNSRFTGPGGPLGKVDEDRRADAE